MRTSRINPGRRSRRAFTLIEVVVSIAIVSIVLTAIGSLMVVSARALPNPNDPTTAMVGAGTAACQFADDARQAMRVTEAGAMGFTFTVPDRDSDTMDESVRYAWSGTSGDPLVRTVNSDRHEIVVDRAGSVAFTYERSPSDFPIVVLLVVPDPLSMTAQDVSRQTLIEGWGYQVKTIAASAPASAFDTAVESATVAYISEQIDGAVLGTKLVGAPIGVVIEEGSLYDEFGISTSAATTNETSIRITNNSHPISLGFSGTISICSTSSPMYVATGTESPDLTTLAEDAGLLSPLLGKPILAVLERGSRMAGTTETSAGRRVVLPWGASGFDIGTLRGNGLTIMQRSIEWASEHDVITSVRLTVSGADASSATTQRQVNLLNLPREPGP
jgi:prepilin-type N-terminal cleavage/methylation domain-containing protein